MKPAILQVDNLDDRREIWLLLHRLSPKRRVAFVGWCCGRAGAANGYKPMPSVRNVPVADAAYHGCDQADEQLTNMLYTDLLFLSLDPWTLDLSAAAAELEKWVKRQDRIL